MQVKIIRLGEALAVRIPPELAGEAQLQEGATVDLEVKDGDISLTLPRMKLTLAELLQDGMSAEFDWGRPAGSEAW